MHTELDFVATSMPQFSTSASRRLEQMGHEAVVIDARKAKGVIRTKKKTDRLERRRRTPGPTRRAEKGASDQSDRVSTLGL
jgi:hypothetical protein